MASYLLQIKRSLPYEMQDQFKLSAPNIKELVFDLYESTDNDKLKNLTSAFLESTGENVTDYAKRIQGNTFTNVLNFKSKLFNSKRGLDNFGLEKTLNISKALGFGKSLEGVGRN